MEEEAPGLQYSEMAFSRAASFPGPKRALNTSLMFDSRVSSPERTAGSSDSSPIFEKGKKRRGKSTPEEEARETNRKMIQTQ
jgi:hypothetical protein